jgi:hypothetical protein
VTDLWPLSRIEAELGAEAAALAARLAVRHDGAGEAYLTGEELEAVLAELSRLRQEGRP